MLSLGSPCSTAMDPPLSAAADEKTAWGNVDAGTDDPEEIKVIFSALDSFR